MLREPAMIESVRRLSQVNNVRAAFVVLRQWLVIAGVVGTYWLRPLMSVGYLVINVLMTPLLAVLR